MIRNHAFTCGKPALALCALFLLPLTLLAEKPRPYPFRGSNGFGIGVYAPSYYGYPLDEVSAGYYGGSRYNEFYSYGRGYGWATYPGFYAGRHYPPDYRGTGRYLGESTWLVPTEKPAASPLLQGGNVARLKIEVPAEAEVRIEGQPTKQAGTTRWFETPPLQRGEEFVYDIQAQWQENGKPVVQKQQVKLQAGDQIVVQFPTAGEPAAPLRLPVLIDE